MYPNFFCNLRRDIPIVFNPVALMNSFSLKDIADLIESGKAIPPIQRGLVWNPTRIEVLWDSLMRGIPIGTFSTRTSSSDGHIEILDGQQRANAIYIAYKASFSGSDKGGPILWIDLSKVNSSDDKEDDSETKVSRRYFFRLTTAAHPWGYPISTEETSCVPFGYSRQKEVVDYMEKHSYPWERRNVLGARPYPYELWPIDNDQDNPSLPIPFQLLLRFAQENSNNDYNSFVDWLGAQYHTSEKLPNWYQRFYNELQSLPKGWPSIIDAIRNLHKIRIYATDASGVSDKDLPVYFRRMNKAGLEPSPEEMQYSMLKNTLGMSREEVGIIDQSARGILSSSRFANIALRFWFMTQSDKKNWKTGISHKDLFVIPARDGFRKFLLGEGEGTLRGLFISLKKELGLPSEDSCPKQGLLSYHLVRMARESNGDLLLLLLLLLSNGNDESISILGLAAYIQCFSETKNIGKTSCIIWENKDNIKLGLFKAMGKKYLCPPVFKDDNDYVILKAIANKLTVQNIVESCQRIQSIWNGPMSLFLNRTWDGFRSGSGTGMLIAECREYIYRVFDRGYDLSSPEWQEQNKPWDYDHILPKSWCWGRTRGRPRIYNYDYVEVCGKMLRSVGNCCPIPFTQNREKNANDPGEEYPSTYGGSYKDVLVDINSVSLFHRSSDWRYQCIDTNEGMRDPRGGVLFIKTTLNRFFSIYETWFDGMGIAELLKMPKDILNSSRKVILLREVNDILKDKGFNCKYYYTHSNGFQYEIRPDYALDWVKGAVSDTNGDNWLVLGYYSDSHFVALASDGDRIQVGVRRKPDEATYVGDDGWFYTRPDHSSYKDENFHYGEEYLAARIADRMIKFKSELSK